ncbi:hypothetical protein OG563_22230 [Nocardia vinacea]|uniref:Threonyl-tRNA synthetase editing domain-containing protein n=1 Tax=Nocardia vinacea TaxID=96468 RepID=A0ABZ1Z9E7_9NOCA|nr:threonyl-tRNA synthetase editing domain-containing protein [Nocardia vinacea]
MWIHTSRCRTFRYAPTTANACAVELAPSAVGATRLFFDCLVLTVGVERGDLALGAAATQIVRRIATETDAAYIVISGFAQLTSSAERSSTATGLDLLSHIADVLDLLSELTERLEERGERVHLMPFGWHKRSHAEVCGQRVIHLPHATDRTGAEPAETVVANCSVDHDRSRICPRRDSTRHYRFRRSTGRRAM